MVAAVPPPTVAAEALATSTTERARTTRRAPLRIFMVKRTRSRRGPYRGGSTSTYGAARGPNRRSLHPEHDDPHVNVRAGDRLGDVGAGGLDGVGWQE